MALLDMGKQELNVSAHGGTFPWEITLNSRITIIWSHHPGQCWFSMTWLIKRFARLVLFDINKYEPNSWRVWIERKVAEERICPLPDSMSWDISSSPALGLGLTLLTPWFSDLQTGTWTTPPTFLDLQLACLQTKGASSLSYIIYIYIYNLLSVCFSGELWLISQWHCYLTIYTHPFKYGPGYRIKSLLWPIRT